MWLSSYLKTIQESLHLKIIMSTGEKKLRCRQYIYLDVGVVIKNCWLQCSMDFQCVVECKINVCNLCAEKRKRAIQISIQHEFDPIVMILA